MEGRPRRAAAERTLARLSGANELDNSLAAITQLDQHPPRASTSDLPNQLASAEGAAEYVIQEEEEEDYYDEKEEEKKKKRVKKAKARKNQRKDSSIKKGSLSVFATMPLDILAEICSHLDPATLLSLSRTSSSVYQLMRSPACSNLWRTARRNIHLPDLEALALSSDEEGHVSEFRYAELMFDGTCEVCEERESNHVDYFLKVRCCKSCQGATFLHCYSSTFSKLDGCTPNRHLQACLLRGYGLYADYRGQPTPSALTSLHAYLRSQWKTVNDDLNKLTKSHIIAKLSGKESESDLTKYKDAKMVLRDMSFRDGQKMFTWAREAANEAWEKREEKKREIGAKRKVDIEEKMIDLGFERQDFGTNWDTLELLTLPTALTTRVWNSIKEPLIELVTDIRDARLAKERRQARRQQIAIYHSTLQASQPSAYRQATFPQLENFMELSTVIKLLWATDELTDESWEESYKDDIQAEVDDQTSRTERAALIRISRLLELLPASFGLKGQSSPELERLMSTKLANFPFDDPSLVLSLPTSLFACSACKTTGPYLRMAQHDCPSRKQGWKRAWRLNFLEGDIVSMLDLISLLGIAESAGMESELDDLGRIVECTICNDGMRRDWNKALSHTQNHYQYGVGIPNLGAFRRAAPVVDDDHE